MRFCSPSARSGAGSADDHGRLHKRTNPSNFSLVILSEGAEWQGYTVKEYGEADAFGHRKKMSVAEDLSDEIKRATGEETIFSDLTYDLRSGSPDFVDRLVAFALAGMAMDADPWTYVFVGTIGAALAMLGPGFWSVDARLYGWKRIDPL